MFSWFPILFPLKVSSLVGTELNAKVEKWEWIDKSPCSFLPTATHLHIPGRWCHSAILALQQREEGLVWMGCDGALLLCHSQPRRPFLHHRPVKKTRRHKLADSCVSVRLCGSGRTGVVTLFTQLKTWTCASPWKSAVVGTLQFRKNGSDKPNLNLFLFLNLVPHSPLSPEPKVYCCCEPGSFRLGQMLTPRRHAILFYLSLLFWTTVQHSDLHSILDLCLIKHTFHTQYLHI